MNISDISISDTSISIEELKKLEKNAYQIIDIRDPIEISHGAITDAIALRPEEIENSKITDVSKKTGHLLQQRKIQC